MIHLHSRRTGGARRARTGAAIAAAACLALAACGSGSGAAGGGGGGGDETVKITVLTDSSGKAAFFGTAIADSAKFTEKYINDKGGMDGKKVVIDVQDTTSAVGTASQQMAKAVSGDTDAVIFGVLTEEALAIAPLAQDAKLPMVNIQAGGDGVTEVGDYIWRITPQQALFYPKFAKYLAEKKGTTSASVFYVTDNAPSVELATKVMPKAFADAGIKVLDKVASSSTETDLSGAVSKLMKGNPDHIQTQAIGAQNVTLITQLRRAGYKGTIGGGTSLGAGALTDLPADQSNGILYYSSFVGSPDLPWKAGSEFSVAYEKATGDQPNTFHAETFDAFNLIQEAVLKSGGSSREDIEKGMNEVASSGGLAAAQAEKLTFDERDAKGPGVVIEWQDGKETLAPGQ
ncbi:ABC transporter substrate-binding protein [Aeromicrobium sp. CFBP 8757]|uniref:ABC transporter substrate-binding protein n=1 Tax=Aeromicrobium sp. CFBP 8757 TaxID=2775288 RepID=UPI001783E3CF|nr:ABC transporter substrate-binding protein [Aeromicrobium sp. CFBP 8757]MBD8605493.1 ABC transporter substrate-binding protein [Aeromicrobium sp. CFBP 8757]